MENFLENSGIGKTIKNQTKYQNHKSPKNPLKAQINQRFYLIKIQISFLNKMPGN
jgi:hypothetical protein